MSKTPHRLAIEVPPEIQDAADAITKWANSNNLRFYALRGVCSIGYFNIIQRLAPSLKKLSSHPNGLKVIKAHNLAVGQLKSLVTTENTNSNPRKN